MTLQMEPPVPPPRRSVSTTCDLHPGETFTGFCAACLRERLAGLEANDAAAAAPGRKSTSAIRSLFSRPLFAAAAAGGGGPSGSGGAPTALPDLRRCKSFSCGRGGDALAAAVLAGAAGGGAYEPQRRSCDVRGRSTLWALFHQDDRERVRDGTAFGAFPASSSAAEVLPPPQLPPPPPACVPEMFLEEEITVVAEEDSDEIVPVMEPVLVVDTSGEMETEVNAARDVRAMKDHIDLESSQSQQPPNKKVPPKDLKEIAGSFWLAASVFSKKWQKWRRKQKLKKQEAAAAAMPPPEKPSKPSFLRRSRFRRGEAGSEFAGGRRSCDTDPRFSLDAGRMSVDDMGFSWDEPRASWDGYLFGAGTGVGLGRAPPPFSRLPPILSALEDSPAGIVERSDGQIPVEDDSQPEPNPDTNVPGGTAQTRDYYMDTSNRRRRSLDRSSSVRRSFEVTDPKPVPVPVPVPVTAPAAAIVNGNKSPIMGSSEFYHFHHAEDLFDHRFSTTSLVEDFSASLDAAFHGGPAKKPRRWRKAWSLWGLIHRRAAGRRNGASDGGADRAFSEPWPELRVRGYNGRMMPRCNSNASARSSFSSNSGGGLGSSRRSYVDAANHGHVKRRREEYCAAALERNRSARHSPGNAADNGMLRFYLTPIRSASGRRTAILPVKGGRQSFARTMLGLY
ncbi:protein OCTOPUS-like [Miscanthus floridulus]|uniref:protein OCTOPUS-like n=1 Tax=Miscanthus floridulus TaxID=154761 RepID=UPI003459C3A0